ncbi:hypothetical protein OG21DRAFT_1490217 [Imleria badia]|nr:hypothetical protein OG21DRAFT_1490217 [Imleria badia]
MDRSYNVTTSHISSPYGLSKLPAPLSMNILPPIHSPSPSVAQQVRAAPGYQNAATPALSTRSYNATAGQRPSPHGFTSSMSPISSMTVSPAMHPLSPPIAEQAHTTSGRQNTATQAIQAIQARPMQDLPASDDEILQPLLAVLKKTRNKQESKLTQKKGPGWKADAIGYSDDETMHLFKIIEKILPLGKQSWEVVTNAYNQFATCHKYPTRTSKALRTKFDSICATKKPMGDAELPPHVKMAWKIQDAITEKLGTVALSDSDASSPVSEGDKDSEDSEDNAKVATNKKPQSVIKAYRANALLQPTVRQRRSSASDTLASLTAALSPATLKE